MRVPFFDLKRLYHEQKNEIDVAVIQVLESGWYVHGEAGVRFEKNFSTSLYEKGQTQGTTIGCNSGTDAIVLSLLASEVHPGEEVITVSHTALPTATAIHSIGALPRYVDIDSETWVLDPSQLSKVVTSKSKALVAVHLYGNMVDIPRVKAELQRLGREDISIIEDVAQAQSSNLNGRQAGTLGRIGTFSFYPTKNLGAIGDGGAVHCSNEIDGKNVRMLANYGQESRYHSKLPRGINSRLDEIQASLLDLRLKKIEGWNKIKESQVEKYRNDLQGLPVQFQMPTSGTKPAWHLCVIALENEKTRNGLVSHLKEEGIETMIHYPTPNHLQPALKQANAQQLPNTESLAKRIVSLPMNCVLRDEEQAAVIKSIRSFFSHERVIS